MKIRRLLLGMLVMLPAAGTIEAQTFPTDDPVIQRMWDEGMGDG